MAASALSSLARSRRTCAASESIWRCVGCWAWADVVKKIAAVTTAYHVRLISIVLSCVYEILSLRDGAERSERVRRELAEGLERGR